jgi:hypothetical protein
MQTQNSFAHGQVISFNDGQAIIVQNPDQSGGHQSMFSNQILIEISN